MERSEFTPVYKGEEYYKLTSELVHSMTKVLNEEIEKLRQEGRDEKFLFKFMFDSIICMLMSVCIQYKITRAEIRETMEKVIDFYYDSNVEQEKARKERGIN